jgi:membrane fusion protein, multidrug efflux system
MNKSALIAGAVVFGVILAVGTGLWAYKSRKDKAGQMGGGGFEPASSVDLTQARMASWQPTADLVGTVFPLQSIMVSNEVAGVVKTVGFQTGELIESGSVLLQLDDATERADLAAAEASVRVSEASVVSAEVRIRLAETNLNRLTRALEARAVADAEVDTAKAELDRAKADLVRIKSEVDQAKSRVDQVKVAVEKKTIKAPFKGRTGIRSVHPGQFLKEGTDVVGLQGIAEKIYLDFAIPQDQAYRARPGMKVRAKSAIFGAEPIEIEVMALDATVSTSTRNVRIRGIVDNPGERLKPGMSVDVQVPVADAAEYVVVPSSAIRRASFGDHVFVVGPGKKEGEMRAQQRFVKTGPLLGSVQIVLEGLKVGEQVAADGSFKLRDGALVMPGKSSAGK